MLVQNVMDLLYGCDTWSLILREEHMSRLKMYESKVLRIFAPRRDEVVGGWRRQLEEEFHNLYTSSNFNRMIKPRKMRWAGHVVCMGEMRNACKIVVRNSERKKSLGKPRHR
jgi:hypothetical protein